MRINPIKEELPSFSEGTKKDFSFTVISMEPITYLVLVFALRGPQGTHDPLPMEMETIPQSSISQCKKMAMQWKVFIRVSNGLIGV